MSDDTEDESTDGSGQQPAEGDQPSAEEQPVEQTDQSTEQSEEQPSESDQSAEQTEGPAVADDQATEPSQEQPADSDLPTNQADEQAVESDQTADQSGDPTGEGGGGSGSGGESASGGTADDAVPAGGGGGGHKLKVIAEFTQEGGQKFMGEDIKIVVAEWDSGQQRRFLFPIDLPDRQKTVKKGNVITTGLLAVSTNEVIIYPEARVRLPLNMLSYQNITGAFVFTVPAGATLQTKFDVTVQPVDKTVKAAQADEAKGIAAPPAKQYASFDLKAEPVGNQQFHVTGKYYSGDLNSPDGRRI